MNNAVFGKTMENVRKHRDIKLVTTNKRRNRLVSEPSYHTTEFFSENLLVIEIKKTKVKMNKPVYLGMSILDISETLMYEFWYDKKVRDHFHHTGKFRGAAHSIYNLRYKTPKEISVVFHNGSTYENV